LLKEDQGFQQKLAQQHRHGMKSVEACSDIVQEICNSVRATYAEAKSSFEQSLMTGQLERVNIKKLVDRIYAVIETIRKHVPIEICVDESAPNEIIADSSKILRCAISYLIIACKRTLRGVIALRLFVRRDSYDSKKALLFVTCEDTAPPIKLNMYEHLFTPPAQGKNVFEGQLQQGDDESKPFCPELSLSSVACEMNVVGGEYGFRPRNKFDKGCEEYDNELGVVSGSVFWFCVPCSELEDTKVMQSIGLESTMNGSSHQVITREVATKLQQSITGEFLPDRNKRVLVIEDSKVVRKMLTKIITTLGFEVSQVENGMEGLEKLKSSLFDLTLCDFLMPIMDGFDCVQQYRDWEKYHRPWIKQRIIGISAHATPGDIERGMKVGMDDCRNKPITVKVLSQLVRCEEQVEMSNRLDAIEMREAKSKYVDNGKSLRSHSIPKTNVTHGRLFTCLVIAPTFEKDHVNLMQSVIKSLGWQSTISCAEGEVLRWLKMRMWDVVLVDEAFAPAISVFRKWESKKRKTRQRRIILMTDIVQINVASSTQPPEGIDVVTMKPLCLSTLEKLLQWTAFDLNNELNSK
jgi:two-component system, chemotaxis family, chemotaxis protein CheY